MQQKSKIVFSILFLFCFNFPNRILQAIEVTSEITLTKNGEEIDFNFYEEGNSDFIYITGEIDNSKKYLLISLKSENINSFISITKKKDFDVYKDEYDYTLLPQENKLVLPSLYFDANEVNGFYIRISWENENNNITLNFKYLDKINLEIGEEFSFFAKSGPVENFQIEINNENKNLNSNLGNIGFIVSGGDEKQLSMSVNKNKANKMINNVFAYWMSNDLDKYLININVSENVKFVFKSQIFDTEEELYDKKNLEQNLFNQFFFVINNREECFNLKSNEEENERDLIVLSQENFSIDLYMQEQASDLIHYDYIRQNSESYAISDNLKLNNTINKICIKINKEFSADVSFIQIYFYDKLNKYNLMPEPLIPGIKYNLILPKKDPSLSINQNNINIHTHSQFFLKNHDESDIIGINANIKLLSGKIKLYTDQCNTYPKCGINDNSRFLKEIYSIDGYFHTLIKSNSDTNSESNKQKLFKVVCEDEQNDCKYEILFTDNQKKEFIRSGDKISKYLEPYQKILNSKVQDSYFTFLHSTRNKIVINLAIFSGDAYIVQINDIKGCKFDEEHFGSDERRIFHCNENEMDEFFDINNLIQIKIEFSIRAGKNGAVYSLNIYEQSEENQEIYIPVETSKFEIISDNNNKFKILENKVGNEILGLIYPINCDINLINGNNTLNSSENNFLQFYYDSPKSFIDLILEKYNNYNNINKCLLYLSSYSHSKEDSFLIITENKPLKFKLNSKLNNIRIQYLYEISKAIKRLYLKVNNIGNSAIKIKIININEENTNEYIIKDNKIITIMDEMNNDIKGISLNNISKLKIYIELLNKNLEKNEKEAFVELQIITDLDSPNFLKNGEQFCDILIGAKYKYFITLINKGSSGYYNINLNNNNLGNIYARLLDSDHIKEIGGWNNRFILPNDTTDKNKLLPFDFENQKLIIQKEHTQFCNKYCYLLIGVKLYSDNNYIDLDNKLITGFNSYLQLYNDGKDSIEKEKIFINLKNDEIISSYVTDEENNYFSFKLNEYNNKLNINFNCDNCIMTIVFNDTNFNSNNAKKIISNGNNKNINLGDDKNIRNSIAYIKINTLNNENLRNKNNIIKYKYTLRLISPNDIDNSFNYIDGSIPETCEFTAKNIYYDYAIKLDTYNSEKDINIIAEPNNDDDNNDGINKNLKNDIEIYANIVSDDGNITSNSWPSKEKHQFPQKEQNSSNFLNINKIDIKNEKGKEDKIMLIRIYGKENNKINLYTNYEDIYTLKEKDLLIPGKYQLITVNNSNSDSGFKINFPPNLDKNKEYIYKIKKIEGNGKITYGDNIYELNDKYDSISFPIDKNIPSSKNIINIKNSNLKNRFTFLIKYEEKNNFNSLEKAKIGRSKYFSLKDDTQSIEYYIPLNNNINEDLPININFEKLHSIEDDDYINQIRNNTEIFDIEGYLINEDELNDIKNGNISFMIDKKEFKYKGNYYLENKHGFLNINKNDIDNFKKKYKNTNHYVYFIMKKSKINDKKYDNINGNINIFPNNNTQFPLPENDFYFNSLDCTKNNWHIYKLGDKLKNKNDDISYNTHNMTIEFLSPIEGIKAKVVRDIKKKEDDSNYFDIIRKNNDNGKDTIIIGKNIDDVYLLIETPDKILNKTDDYKTNIDYMFKYSYERKDLDETKIPKIEYNNTILYSKMKNTDLKTNITLNKIKDSKNKIIPCNYYIRIYKNKNNGNTNKNQNNFYPKKNVSLINNNDLKDIYAIYKIHYNNSLLKNEKEENFTICIEIDTDDPVIVDVLAENVQDKKIYGYSKGYPNSDEDFDIIDDDNGGNKGEDDGNKGKNSEKDKNKNGNGISLIKFILIFICALLLLILLCVCCIKTCSSTCCERKDKSDGLKDITFNTLDDEGDNNITVSSYN